MRDRSIHQRQMVVAWDGWPIPEIFAGAIVGAVLGLVVVTLPPGVANMIPDVAGVIAGALVVAVLSYVWRPRHITAVPAGKRDFADEVVRTRAA